jgi:Lrp/AsnC family transcriptional regulator for asnA, asnC and gidA
MIDDIEGVYRTETMISLKKVSTTKKRLMHTIFKKYVIHLNAIF